MGKAGFPDERGRECRTGPEIVAEWLTRVAEGEEPFALSELVLHGFVRVGCARGDECAGY